MPAYFFPTGTSVVVVNTLAQENGDTLLRYELGSYREHYLRRPDKTLRDAKAPRWFLDLTGTFMPIRESDVPNEIRQAWVYCYERVFTLPRDLDPHYAV